MEIIGCLFNLTMYSVFGIFLVISCSILLILTIDININIFENKSVLPESPRWLLSKNKQDEALEILRNVAKTNKRELKIETWTSLVEKQSVC